MAIPETQLDTWAKQGSITQSASTYATIKGALEAGDAGYASRSYQVFLQGSYCNDTNVWSESDVDVVIRLDSMFHYDITALSPLDAQSFENAFPGSASGYSYGTFKGHVVAALLKSFGKSVVPGDKAIKVSADGGRRNADVIVATDFRRYRKFPPGITDMDQGICFFTKDFTRVANYPKDHSKNCTAKHQATNGWFKPMVRIFKNMRNRLVNKGLLAAGIAPSYYIEGLLYNVPNELFGTSYAATFIAAFNWLFAAERSTLVCANYQYYLFGSSNVQWTSADCDLYLNAIRSLWNDWQG